MIISAVSLFRKVDVSGELNVKLGEKYLLAEKFPSTTVHYNGRKTQDGQVRVFATYSRPATGDKFPAVLLLSGAEDTEAQKRELIGYFVSKGYAVLAPDYCGDPYANPKVLSMDQLVKGKSTSKKGTKTDEEQGEEKSAEYTVYPPSLSYANYASVAGLYSLESTAEKTCWFEWLGVALASIKYLKTLSEITNIGVIGNRIGGEIAWKTMLSPDVKCGVPINAFGWQSYLNFDKFGENPESAMNENRRCYIAGIESQSYAPFVKCPVLILCAMRDGGCDYDRAYDTFSRIGQSDGSAIFYSSESGECIGSHGLKNMELFLERHLKDREIYIPKPVQLNFASLDGEPALDAVFDEDGILEEVGVYYAETGEHTESEFRNWQQVYKSVGKPAHRLSVPIHPFNGASYGFAYAYGKYINGFRTVSKIAAKKFENPVKVPVKNHVIFSGGATDCFGVANCVSSALGGIFLEADVVPRRVTGYGNLQGVYSPAGLKTYKISSPSNIAEENALLKFDAYSKQNVTLVLMIEVVERYGESKRYQYVCDVAGGGKWKRIIVHAKDFKNAMTGEPLQSFANGLSLSFRAVETDVEFAVTNILWL